jgi:hypothetical protein
MYSSVVDHDAFMQDYFDDGGKAWQKKMTRLNTFHLSSHIAT